MITHDIKLRVQYCDTDQMGFVHHSNYAKYFELARMDLLRAIGIPYRSIEDAGFIMPVVDIKIHYIKPAFFDEELHIETTLCDLKGPRIMFLYKIINADGTVICRGETTLAFAGMGSKKACHPPDLFTDMVHRAALGV